MSEIARAATARTGPPAPDALWQIVADQVVRALGHACTVRQICEDGEWRDLVAMRPTRNTRPPAAGGPSRETITVPVARGEWRIAEISATRLTPGPPYTETDVRFLEQVAAVAALAVAHVGLHRDHRDLEQRARRLERLAAAGQRAAGVAHDVNNIVTVIKVYAELLESEAPLDAAARDRLHVIRTQAERAVCLAWEVLDTAHRLPLETVEVDVVPFLEDFVAAVGRLLPPGVAFSVDYEDGADERCRVLADPTRLHQILTNLVANAGQALGDGGRLTIRVRSSGEWVEIDVADTGAGIPSDVLPHVFEPFFSTKPRGRGTGLGLSQVRALVAEHGGDVEIASALGRGTVVRLWIPAAPDRDPSPGPGAGWRSLTKSPGRGEGVLVVEDDPCLRDALVATLEFLGYRPEGVADGEEALGWLARHGDGTAAVISDVAMPGIGGEGLVRRMAVAWPELPVILTTTPRPGDSPPGPARPLGDHDGTPPVFRVPKPFTFEELAGVLRRAVG